MEEAAQLIPVGHLNRPFVQYHAARAAAQSGAAEEAAEWLRTAWEEDIESLMISFAVYDPAFEAIAESPSFTDVMRLPESLEVRVRALGGSVHLLEGAGSNVVVQTGADGALLVDTGYGPALPAVRDALRRLGVSRVDRLVVTHAHEDHMGATPELGAEATVWAHPGTAQAMAEPYEFIEGVVLPPKPAAARPEVLVATDTVVSLNGEQVRIHSTTAHTTGDLSVYFTESRVAHLGDTYLPGEAMMFPGGSDPVGFLDDLDAFLDSMHPRTVVVGGHGAPVGLGEVREQIETSRAAIAAVRAALSRGLTVEELADAEADRFPAAWVAFFYRALGG